MGAGVLVEKTESGKSQVKHGIKRPFVKSRVRLSLSLAINWDKLDKEKHRIAGGNTLFPI